MNYFKGFPKSLGLDRFRLDFLLRYPWFALHVLSSADANPSLGKSKTPPSRQFMT
jgi:hypothetical protein